MKIAINKLIQKKPKSHKSVVKISGVKNKRTLGHNFLPHKGYALGEESYFVNKSLIEKCGILIPDGFA